MIYSAPKEILEWIRSHLAQKLPDLTIDTDDRLKQWRLTVTDEKRPLTVSKRTTVGISARGVGLVPLCYLTVGLHEIRLSSSIWNGRNREFSLADPALLVQITQHIKFCIVSSS